MYVYFSQFHLVFLCYDTNACLCEVVRNTNLHNVIGNILEPNVI